MGDAGEDVPLPRPDAARRVPAANVPDSEQSFRLANLSGLLDVHTPATLCTSVLVTHVSGPNSR